MYRRILLFVLIGFSVSPVVAQRSLSVTTNTASSSNTGVGKFYYANPNEPPRAVEFEERTVTVSYFLANISRYFNIPSEFTFVEAESSTDKLGMRHRLLRQYYKGIPLEGMGYRIHEKDGFIKSVNGKAVRDIKLDMQVILSEEQAFDRAVKYLQTKDTTVRDGKKLIVSKRFTFAPESFSIAFQFDIDVSLIERWRISIDARNGQVINKVSLVNTCFNEEVPPLPYGTGTGLTRYYGNKAIRIEKFSDGSSRLAGRTENGGKIGTYDFANGSLWSWIFGYYTVYDFYSADNTFNSPYHKPAVSVQWAAEQAYEYYFKKHYRYSYDNNGSEIISYVHVDYGLNNAFWSNNRLLFGDGDNNNPLVELDVVGHELTHGVTQYEAGLQYYNESGALNESFSDIFGKAIEFYTFGDTATWQMAKHYQIGGLRDFSNPNLKNQPDTYLGNLWFTGSDDNGGVHYNSGVQNFWFYLLCKGGSGVNDHQVSYSVNSIGMNAAANIAYRNLTEYLDPFSDYLDSRIGSLLAAADLYGKNSATYLEVDKAWDAVGVDDDPIITSLELYDITATTVKIKGTLTPRGNTVTYHFEYGTTPALGTSSSSYNYTDKVEGTITGLQSATKYYLRLVASNENGSSYVDTEFTTISLAPLVNIKQTIDVTETTAKLYGQINPNSLSTSFYFEYGPTPAFGLTTPSYQLSGATEFLNVSADVIDLQPRQTYYYRLVATNGFASAVTESASFFTALKPTITGYTPVTASPGTEVTITGSNFNPISEKNLVSFGATNATVLSSSSTEIKVIVPAGASFGPISLVDAESGLSAESVQEFVPTFTGEFKKSDIHLNVGINDINVYKTLVQDIDGDGKPDIVASYYQGFSVFQNVHQGGDITSESFIRNTQNATDLTSIELYAADIDGNGLKDIIVQYQNGIRIYPNFSVPGYIFFGVPVDVPVGYIQDFAVNDFDMDGRVDIAYVTPGSETTLFTIVRNQNPRGTLSANNFVQQYTQVLPYYAYYLTTGDLNNDGLPDLMTNSYYGNFLSMLTNKSHPGTFAFEESIVIDATRGIFVRYVAHDLNQDSWKDIVSHNLGSDGNMAVFENQGTSPNITLTPPEVLLSGYTESIIRPADINGDGKVDLLAGTDQREFIFLKNKAAADEQLSSSSFEKFGEFGTRLVNQGSVTTRMTINDLNGDGRPDIINSYSYSNGYHDGYTMEIWQNSPGNCIDPELVTVESTRYTATIVLPPNTSLDQFEIEWAYVGWDYWNTVYSTTLYLSSGYSYKLRVRSKCYLGFSEYYYINFTVDCVDANSFYISNVGINSVTVDAYDLYSFEIQCSPAGKEQWKTLPQWSNQILDLSPGTTYDLRFRGRCGVSTEFKYRQFTTLCPTISSLFISDVIYNKAVVNWTSAYIGNPILEYSEDNVNWTLIDNTRTMSNLIPGKQYFVRGALECTDINSDFIYTSFTTPCPSVSTVNVETITAFSAMIKWVDQTKTGHYTLTYSMTAGGAITTIETNSTSFNLHDLSPGTQYTVNVAPACINSKIFTSTVFTTVCYAPFEPSVNGITHTTAELSWNDNFSGPAYSIDYSIAGSEVWTTSETSSTNLSLTELRPGSEYIARVHINCPNETSPYAAVVFKTKFYEKMRFAPNPTFDKITIYPSKNLIGNHYSICDNVGKEVASGELVDYTIDLSVFSPGMYTLKIKDENVMRIIKQ